MKKFSFHKYWIGQNIHWGFFRKMERKIQMNSFGQLSRCWIDMYWDHNHFHVSLTLSPLLIKDHIFWCSFPGGPVVKNPSLPWVGKILWRRKWQHTLAFLPEKFHGQRDRGAWWAIVHGVAKSHLWLTTHAHHTESISCSYYFLLLFFYLNTICKYSFVVYYSVIFSTM